MKDSQKKQIVAAIKAEMQAKKLTQNAWADKKGVGRSHMTNIMKPENWSKVGQRTWNELANLVTSITNGYNLYETSNMRIIRAACQDAQENKRVVAISGYTGAGKTSALKTYDSNSFNTHYLACRSSFGVKDMVSRIAASMGIQARSGRVLDIEEAIIQKMNNSSNSLLILDSVSKLRKDAALQFIGDLCEATEHKAGIVIAGTEFLYDYMTKMVERNKRGFREFDRRIYAWTHLPSFTEGKIQKEAIEICRANGIWNDQHIKHILKSSTCFGSLDSSIKKMKKALQQANRN